MERKRGFQVKIDTFTTRCGSNRTGSAKSCRVHRRAAHMVAHGNTRLELACLLLEGNPLVDFGHTADMAYYGIHRNSSIKSKLPLHRNDLFARKPERYRIFVHAIGANVLPL